jgi:exosortase/archaeosortase family protein
LRASLIYGFLMNNRVRWGLVGIALLLSLPFTHYLNTHQELELRRASATLATGFLRVVGVHAVRSDTSILTDRCRFEVLLPCSGGKFLSLTVAVGLSALVLGHAGWHRRSLLLALLLPLALAANAVRVTLLVLHGPDTGPLLHSALGVSCFAILCLIITTWAGVGRPQSGASGLPGH